MKGVVVTWTGVEDWWRSAAVEVGVGVEGNTLDRGRGWRGGGARRIGLRDNLWGCDLFCRRGLGCAAGDEEQQRDVQRGD